MGNKNRDKQQREQQPQSTVTVSSEGPVTVATDQVTLQASNVVIDAAKSEDTMLVGSSVQPSMVKVAGFEVQLGEAVQGAFKTSGLTPEQWNALPDEDREQRIAAVIDQPGASEQEFAVGAGTPQPGETTGTPGPDVSKVEDGPEPETPAADQAAAQEELAAGPIVAEVAAPSAALIKGILSDYQRVMGPGQQPSQKQGEAQQRKLLNIAGATLAADHGDIDGARAAWKEAFKEGAPAPALLARFQDAASAEVLTRSLERLLG